MKIVKLKGGLGNQMFQYSFAKLLQKKCNEDVKLDTSYFSSTEGDPIRKLRLLNFNTSIEIASDDEIANTCFFKHRTNPLGLKNKMQTIIEGVFNKKKKKKKTRAYTRLEKIQRYSYFDGYWQSWRYVDEIWDSVSKDFSPNYKLDFRTENMIREVESCNSVFIGIRRGDYTKYVSHYGSFGQEYYDKAMEYIEQFVDKPVYYIFSNDIEWVKSNIQFGDRVVVFRETSDIVNDFEELVLMSKCKHSIIINSTYHWWGARLNEYKGKVVVAPKKWFFDDEPIDIVPPRWKTF